MSIESHRLLAELKRSIEASPFASLITDPNQEDNPIIAVNRAFCRLTGYEAEEVTGRNCRLLAGPETSKADSARLAEAIARRSPALVQLMNHRKDGSLFLNAVMMAPVFDEKGKLAFFLGSQMDVSNGTVPSAQMARTRFERLSPRQREVARLMAQGFRNKQIAAHLSISEKTVKMHRAQLLDRLGAASSAEAVRIVVEAGL